jgi:prepilin-type processing-associated H-X9-DG protein
LAHGSELSSWECGTANARLRGHWMTSPETESRAWQWGLGAGCAAIVVAAILVAAPILRNKDTTAERPVCLANVRSISVALRRYAADNDDTLPLAASWCDAVLPYVGNAAVLRCPASGTTRASAPTSDYRLNANLAGARTERIPAPDGVILVFEAHPEWNAAGGRAEMTAPHRGYASIGWADGHASARNPSGLPERAWSPVLAPAK